MESWKSDEIINIDSLSELLKNQFDIPLGQVHLLIASAVIELARMIDSAKMKTLPDFPIHADTHFEILGGYLVVRLTHLHGEENFIKLAKIFNQFNHDFYAHHRVVDRNINKFTGNSSQKCYALAINLAIFLKHIFPAKKFFIEYTNIDFYPSPTEPVHIHNHYSRHPLESAIWKETRKENEKQKSRMCLNEPNDLEKAIIKLKYKINENYLIGKLILIVKYIRITIQDFPVELLIHFYMLSDTLLKKQIVNNYFCLFEQPYSAQKNITIYEFRAELYTWCKRTKIPKPNRSILTDDQVIIKFKGENKDYEKIVKEFATLFDNKNEFKIEKTRNEYKSTVEKEYCNIYINFKKNILGKVIENLSREYGYSYYLT